MKVVDHPYLAGVKCRDDGAVFVPRSGTNKAHWTLGIADRVGYRIVTVSRKHYLVHRLICEAFHGRCPSDKCQVDHIDRNPANNKPDNLRWCSPSENQRNRSVCLEAMKDVVSQTVDRNAYMRTYMRARRAKKKSFKQST